MATHSLRGSQQRTGKVLIITSAYNATVTSELSRGAITAFERSSLASQLDLALEVYHVAGSFEVVPAAAAAAAMDRVHAIVALGCIVKGETNHDEVLGHAVTQALADICVRTGKPVGLGVLTVNTQAQALARAGLQTPKASDLQGNKGAEAMDAALTTLATIRAMRDAKGMGPELFSSPDKFHISEPLQASSTRHTPKKGSR